MKASKSIYNDTGIIKQVTFDGLKSVLKIKVNNMTQIEKNSRIREKGKATRAKRKDQTAKVYEIKLDKSKISKQRSYALQRLFLEGKWFTN
ncbi:MAG: hypothetical protein QXW25_03400, partial [Thermoplasmata archaeon]